MHHHSFPNYQELDVKVAYICGATMMLGKIEGRRRRGQQRLMVGRHHRLNGYKPEQIPGDSEGPGNLVAKSQTEQQQGVGWDSWFLRCKWKLR